MGSGGARLARTTAAARPDTELDVEDHAARARIEGLVISTSLISLAGTGESHAGWTSKVRR